MSLSRVQKRRVAGKGSASSQGKSASAGPAVTEKQILDFVPGTLAKSFVRSKLHEKELAIAGLAPPSDWDGDMPELPNDIASEDHGTLANLMVDFVNALSTATWHASMHYIEHSAYEQIVDYLTNLAVLEADASNEQKRTAQAKTGASVVAASALAASAYQNYVRFRDIAGTLKMKHATVSRVGGFIGDEAEAQETRFTVKNRRGSGRGAERGRARGSVKRKPHK